MTNEGAEHPHPHPHEDTQRTDEPTQLGSSPLLLPALAVAGAVLGWAATFLARWLVTLPWAPLHKPVALVSAIPEPWRTVALVAVGLAAGVVLALVALHEELSLRISGSAVTLTVEGEACELAGSRIALVVRDGKQLVLLDADGGELARERCDLRASRVAEAFTRHGYRWAEQDPYRGEFRRWVPDAHGLPAGANALLAARAHALKRSDGAKDRRELRKELAKAGVYVRDESKRQFVRTR